MLLLFSQSLTSAEIKIKTASNSGANILLVLTCESIRAEIHSEAEPKLGFFVEAEVKTHSNSVAELSIDIGVADFKSISYSESSSLRLKLPIVKIGLLSDVSIVINEAQESFSPDTPGISIVSISAQKQSILRYLFKIGEYLIPIASFQSRRRSPKTTYLSVVIPDISFIDTIVANSGLKMRIIQAYEIDGTIIRSKEIIKTRIDSISNSIHATSRQIVLSGDNAVVYSPKVILTPLDGVKAEGVTKIPSLQSPGVSTGGVAIGFPPQPEDPGDTSVPAVVPTQESFKTSFRRMNQGAYQKDLKSGKLIYYVASPDYNMNPGDTMLIGGDYFTIGTVEYAVTPTSQIITIAEA